MPETPPRRPMDQWDDRELADLFREEPDLYELSRSLRASRPEPVRGPHFEPYLRARLMDAATRELRPRGMRRWLRPRPGLFAGGGAAIGVALIAGVVVATVMYHPNDVRIDHVTTNVAENHAVSPEDVIRVSFTQPVDHTLIERNLQIRPATAVQTRWEDTTLVITPVHHLAANTPYTVTIPRTSVRDTHGDVAQADIHIAFGPRPTPSAGPTAPPAQAPALAAVQLGPVSTDSSVLIAPDGSVVATAGIQTAQQPSPSPSPSSTASGLLPSLLPGQLPLISSPASPTAAPTAAAKPATKLVRFAADGSGATVLGPASSTALFSPTGGSLAYLTTHGSQADLNVASADGSHAVRLVRNADASSPLAWSSEDGLVYLSGGQVMTVDLQGRARSVGGGLHVVAGQDVALAPSGQVAYVGPVPAGAATPSASASASAPASASASPDGSSASPSATPSSNVGHLVTLATGASVPLQGIHHFPAFSADGARVAWVDESGTTPLLDILPTTADASANPASVATAAAPGDTLGALSLSGDGSRVAYTLTHDGATPALRVVSVASNTTVAVGDGQPALRPVLSSAGDRIAFVRTTTDGAQAALATIPGAAAASPAADAVPVDATSILDRFVTAQLNGDSGILHSLGSTILTVTPALTPGGVTRSYVIKSALDPNTGAVTAQVRLVRDASHDRAVSFANEMIKLSRNAAGVFEVTSAAISDFQVEPNGPQIVHVSNERQQQQLVIRIAFDSDLDPSTVTSKSITLTGPQGASLPIDVNYGVESRTVVVRVSNVPVGALSLAVSGALQDIVGQSLASAYSTTVQG